MGNNEAKWSGWRSREIEIRKGMDSAPALLEVSGGLGTKFEMTPLRRMGGTYAPGQGFTVWGFSRRRVIVAPEYNHLNIFRAAVGNENSTGLGGWRVRRITHDEIDPLDGSTSGRGPWIVFVGDGARRAIRVTWNDGERPGVLTMYGVSSGAGTQVNRPDRTEETVRIKGPGYLMFDADRWSVQVT
ncbi:hypothetical protein ACIO1C_06730 [Streptomyces sp. NPDC087420]|uniref:hypothetical protein n=1 Tax=Streptomyces sp. NPDC087420 TaxID=3365785 RepID=UPI0038381182